MSLSSRENTISWGSASCLHPTMAHVTLNVLKNVLDLSLAEKYHLKGNMNEWVDKWPTNEADDGVQGSPEDFMQQEWTNNK